MILRKHLGISIAAAGLIAMAIFFRLGYVGASDVITDEASLGFRAIGLIDFDATIHQPSPWEWANILSSWMRLSMHDHPPLFFIIQHFSLKILGENTIALRLPSAIFGILSAYLIYSITKKLFDEKTAMVAGALSSANVYLIWVSRIGLQESTLIFFFLLSIYFFLKSFSDERFFILCGICVGLSWLTKYTAFILAPIFLTYFIIFDRQYFRNKFFWAGVALALAIFSPVLLYNYRLYLAFGHFDFQFSYVFGQNVAQWQIQPGKEEFKNILDKFFSIFINLKNGLSPAFAGLLLATMVYFFHNIITNRNKNKIFLLLALIFLFLEYIVIGPSQRFLSAIIPFFIIIISCSIIDVYNSIQKFARIAMWKYAFTLLLFLFFVYEAIFSYQTNITMQPKHYYSKDIASHYSYSGYQNLDQWLTDEIQNKKPRFSFDLSYIFLKDISIKTNEKYNRGNFKDEGILFVYDENMNEQSSLWIMHRLMIYHNWPVLASKQYYNAIQKNGDDYYKKLGFEKVYLIKKDPDILGKKFSLDNKNIDDLVSYLKISGSEPYILLNPQGKKSFSIYSL